MTEFTPVSSLFGGVLIGLGASVLLVASGRIAGISGVFGGLLRPRSGDIGWRAAFVAGLVGAGGLVWWFSPESVAPAADRSLWITGLAGLLVGFGVRLGNGCTSGHGVCGLSRFSARSLAAVLTFMGTGIVTASLVQLLFGGAL